MKRFILPGILCLGQGMALANGFRLPDQDAAATARGEAFAATADNPSAIYYNPAGIAQLEGWNVRVGTYGIAFKVEHSGGSETDGDLNVSPQLFAVYAPKDSALAYGLGVYAPFGLALEWPETSGFRSAGLEANLKYVTINPVVAWRVSDKVSIAAGPTFNMSDVKLRQGLSPFPGNDGFTFKGDDINVGFNLGLQWHISEQFVFGAAYRSKTKMSYDGDSSAFAFLPSPSNVQFPSTADLDFPQSAVVGLSWRPTPEWNVEVNVDWTDWSQLKSLTIVNSLNSTPVAGLALNWDASLYYELGVTRKLNDRWHVSAGYIFNENSIPDQNFTPLVPDLNRQFVSLGFGYQHERFSFDVAYLLGWAQSRTVTGSPVTGAGQTADGSYDFSSHSFGVSLGWKF